MRMLIKKFLVLGATFFTVNAFCEGIVDSFPMQNYDQTVSRWISPTDANFDKPAIGEDKQKAYFEIFKQHYFGKQSPWDKSFVESILQMSVSEIKHLEESYFNDFDNTVLTENKKGYSGNGRLYSNDWIEKIKRTISLTKLDNLTYKQENRGIAVQNLNARALPTSDVFFRNPKLPGEGYPFDYLQMSALWIGTPVYILGETIDGSWLLVLTPDYIAWVPSNGIAKTDEFFVKDWTDAANMKLIAITQTNTPIKTAVKNFFETAYVGSVFPGDVNDKNIEIRVPVRNVDGNAVVQIAVIEKDQGQVMPLSPTPHHFADLFQTLIGRPYGWGGERFYNDCSAELKSLFTPFGIWLPRHSSQQVTVSKMVDKSNATPIQKIDFLNSSHPFMTIVHIGGHVFLYVGTNMDNQHARLEPMTYQNLWGLSPRSLNRRAVIGMSVLFPLKLTYPEDQELVSLADKALFQVADLTETETRPPLFLNLMHKQSIDIKSLMLTETLFNKMNGIKH